MGQSNRVIEEIIWKMLHQISLIFCGVEGGTERNNLPAFVFGTQKYNIGHIKFVKDAK